MTPILPTEKQKRQRYENRREVCVWGRGRGKDGGGGRDCRTKSELGDNHLSTKLSPTSSTSTGRQQVVALTVRRNSIPRGTKTVRLSFHSACAPSWDNPYNTTRESAHDWYAAFCFQAASFSSHYTVHNKMIVANL